MGRDTALLGLRRKLVASGGEMIETEALDEDTVLMIRSCSDRTSTAIVVRLRGQGAVILPWRHATGGVWHAILTTEDAEFADDGRPPALTGTREPRIHFSRPSAIVIRCDTADA